MCGDAWLIITYKYQYKYSLVIPAFSIASQHYFVNNLISQHINYNIFTDLSFIGGFTFIDAHWMSVLLAQLFKIAGKKALSKWLTKYKDMIFINNFFLLNTALPDSQHHQSHTSQSYRGQRQPRTASPSRCQWPVR